MLMKANSTLLVGSGIPGNSIFTVEEIRSSIRLELGDTFIPNKVDEDRDNVQKFYGRRGYLDTTVRAIRKPNLDTRAIDLFVRFEKVKKFVGFDRGQGQYQDKIQRHFA